MLDSAADRGEVVAALGMKMVAVSAGKVDAAFDEVFPAVVESKER